MPKSSDAWKALVKRHKKGPKRIKLPGKRRPKGTVPLDEPKKAKVIQLVREDCLFGQKKKVTVVMFREHFEGLNLKQGKTYTMVDGALTLAAKRLLPALDALTHNDRVRQTVHEMKLVGMCNVIAGTARAPDATFHITPSTEDQESNNNTLAYVRRRFARPTVNLKMSDHPIEYL
jgi:hypothetical protein|tara:strand:+ start:3573 stop:4097 length:525 start_codon:yes stop_codon:yes gene_type:complete